MTAASHQVVSTWDPFRGGISEKKLWPYMEAMGNRQIKAAELFLFDGRLGAAFHELVRIAEYMSPSFAAFLIAKFPVIEMLEENISKQALAYAKGSKSFFWI